LLDPLLKREVKLFHDAFTAATPTPTAVNTTTVTSALLGS
jgi:hypothetical protein